MKYSMPRIRVEAELRPTESEDKVKKSILNVFEPERLWVEDFGDRRLVVAEAYSYQSLRKLHELLRRERILDAARSYLLRGMAEQVIVFKLNKQAALMGRISFVDMDTESPMGPITFIIETGRPREVVDWLAPPTRMGRPIYEKDRPSDYDAE